MEGIDDTTLTISATAREKPACRSVLRPPRLLGTSWATRWDFATTFVWETDDTTSIDRPVPAA